MKKLKISSYFIVVLLVGIFSCQDESLLSPNVLSSEATRNATLSFPNIPQEVVEAALEAYGNDTLPAVTIALTYTRGDSAIALEDDWSYVPYSSPDADCIAGERSQYYVEQARSPSLKTIDGFTFLETTDLCGYGKYIFDNRQGGWFDYVCGPQDFSFDYQGDQVFVLVRLWCE